MAVDPVLGGAGIPEDPLERENRRMLRLMEAPEGQPHQQVLGGVISCLLGAPHFRIYHLFYDRHNNRWRIGNFDGIPIYVGEEMHRRLPQAFREFIPVGTVIRRGITSFPPTRFEKALEAIQEVGRQWRRAAEHFWRRPGKIIEILGIVII